MSKLRNAARGRDCMIRLPGCAGGPDTVVLAHYRLSGLSGMGIKPPDLVGAWACHACHDRVDGREGRMGRDEVRLAHAEGVMRTIDALLRDGMRVTL